MRRKPAPQESWNQRFFELQAFKKKHGHCNVPRDFPRNPSLATWVNEQRKNRRQNGSRRPRLGDLGFDFDPLTTLWNQRFFELQAFKKKHGHCNVPKNFAANQSLATWVCTQRSRTSKLSNERLARLKKLGFEFDPLTAAWEEYFSELLAFKRKHGHCNVPARYPKNQSLASWTANQRTRHRKNLLSPARLKRLKKLGFEWNTLLNLWDTRFSELRAFKKKHGHCDVPQSYPQNQPLAAWAANQRTRHRDDKLTSARLALLEAEGFEFNLLNARWEENFSELKIFKRKYGHCRVPNRYPKKPPLGIWVSRQRQHQELLSEDRLARLKKLGFEFDPLAAALEEHFSELKAFKKKHGHCNVPNRYPENPRLGGWAGKQRTKKGALSAKHRARLKKLGFEFDPLTAAWEEHFSELLDFKRKHGHCNVPQRFPENPRFGSWVSTQRHPATVLTRDRRFRLRSAGFDFDPLTTLWNLRFSELQAFKKKHGHCNVPINYPHIPQLPTWVANQRANRRKGKLDLDRLARLKAEGFDFEPLLAAWDKMFNKLLEFRRRYGHAKVPHDTENYELWWWLTHQVEHKAKLSQKQTARLKKLGVAIETRTRI